MLSIFKTEMLSCQLKANLDVRILIGNLIDSEGGTILERGLYGNKILRSILVHGLIYQHFSLEHRLCKQGQIL